MRFIGRKTLLLDQIKKVIDENVCDARTFCDLFAGSVTVGRYFKQWYEVISNDLLYFSYVLQRATIVNDGVPQFQTLVAQCGIGDPIDYLNQMETARMEELEEGLRFFQNTYAPKGNRMYLSNENGLRIDYARHQIQTWFEHHIINENEYYYLLGCLIEGIPFVSNISGTYGTYHKSWDKRALKTYQLYRLDVETNHFHNQAFNQDANQLIRTIQGDILYLDPPYNGRQYLSNYHVLETAATYDYPIVKGISGQRVDEGKKSNFCLKTKVLYAFEDLIKNAAFKHIILSYSTEGLMSINDIETIMKKYGISDTFKIYWIPYRRYKSHQQEQSEPLKEMLVYIQKKVV